MQFRAPFLLPCVVLIGGLAQAMTEELDVDLDIITTRSLLPRAPLEDIYHYARENLDEQHPLVRDLTTHIQVVARSIIDKRMALPLPYAEASPQPKGGGGGGGRGAKVPGDKKGEGDATPPPGLSADGMKAWNQCQQARNQRGDCSAMIGPWASTGCYMARMNQMKPCENGELMAAIRKQHGK